jgi:hypothetical protein
MTVQEYAASRYIQQHPQGTYAQYLQQVGSHAAITSQQFDSLRGQVGLAPAYAGTTLSQLTTAYGQRAPITALASAFIRPGTADIFVPEYAHTALEGVQRYLEQHPPPLQQGHGIREWMTQFLDNNNRSFNDIARWRHESSVLMRTAPIAQMIYNYVDTQMGGSMGTYWQNTSSVNATMERIFQRTPSAGWATPSENGGYYSVEDLFSTYTPGM